MSYYPVRYIVSHIKLPDLMVDGVMAFWCAICLESPNNLSQNDRVSNEENWRLLSVSCLVTLPILREKYSCCEGNSSSSVNSVAPSVQTLPSKHCSFLSNSLAEIRMSKLLQTNFIPYTYIRLNIVLRNEWLEREIISDEDGLSRAVIFPLSGQSFLNTISFGFPIRSINCSASRTSFG